MTSKQIIYKLTGRNTPVRVPDRGVSCIGKRIFCLAMSVPQSGLCTHCKKCNDLQIFFPLTKFSHIHLHWLNAICYNCTNIINILGKMAHSAYRL